ncbi:hypothetical protein [Burkholderia vietnamiensis]|uniref:hypothetical protein n=1 Tax=Burkholderia vietnamiensis TaxID=60552 RepID=UPI001592FD44|nr:hypothetical protein [Burkholderia vietnamiensis]
MNAGVNQAMPLDEQIASIDALGTSEQHQKRERFRELYEAIERALDRKTPIKALLTHLRELGLSLSLNTFQKLLQMEREERTARGESIRCKHCGALHFERASTEEAPSAITAGDRGDDDQATAT